MNLLDDFLLSDIRPYSSSIAFLCTLNVLSGYNG